LSRDGGRTVVAASAQSPVPTSNGFGYRVQATATTADGVPGVGGRATAMYQGPWGTYEAAYARSSSQAPGTASLFASGGLAFIGGALHPTRAIREGFALVRVPGVAGVRAFAQNAEVGRTDAAGDVLVPDLVPHFGNALGISDVDVPIGFEIDAAPKLIAPPYRGGALVEFPVKRLRAYTGSIAVSFKGDGPEVIPAYGLLTVTDAVSAIGGRGDFYLEDVAPGARPARILYLGVTCPFTLQLPDSAEPVTDLGRIVCRTDASRPPPAP
jgi:outer membrane usher protein